MYALRNVDIHNRDAWPVHAAGPSLDAADSDGPRTRLVRHGIVNGLH